jgi:hypothetical protein
VADTPHGTWGCLYPRDHHLVLLAQAETEEPEEDEGI